MSSVPEPCITCRIHRYYRCFLQDHCTRVIAWKRRDVERGINAHVAETARRYKPHKNGIPSRGHWKIEK